MTHLKLVIVTVFFCLTSFSYGQLGFCGGSTGDAIFTESFGNGTNFGPALAPGITTYPFVNGTPNDGFYTLHYLTGLNTSWHNSFDHSPDDIDGINGKCLIVNANNNVSGEFYKRTVTGLCVNTTFEFSAWLMNVYNPTSNVCGNQIPINVRFEIWNDTQTILLGSGNTGNIFGTASPLWQQFALVFTTVNETSVVLIMKNNGIGGCGNDLAIDDIAFKSCGDLTSVSNINFPANNFVTCNTNATVALNAATNGSSTYFYQWQSSTDNENWTNIPGENTDSFTTPGVSVTTYFRTKIAQDIANINSPFCSTVSNVFTVTILPDLNPAVSNGNVVICSSQPIPPLSVTSSNTVSWYDQPTGGNLLLAGSNSYTPTTAGTYYAEVFDPATECFGSSRTAVTLTITQEPIATFTGNLNYCSGETTAINLQSDVVGTTFSWTIAATNVTGAANGSGTTINQNLITNSPSGTVTYLVTPTFNGCPGTPISITVNVFPLPSVIFSSSSDSVCSNQTTDLLFSGTPGATVNFTDGNNNFSTTMNALGIGTFTTAPLTVDTTFTLTSTEISNVVTCSQNSMGSITITINAITAITAQPVGTTICNNGTVTFNVVATGFNLTYQWFLNGTAIPSATGPSYTISSADALDAGDYTVQVSGSCGAAVLSDIATLIITPITTIITPPQAATTVCVGQSLSLNVNASGSGLTYQWYFGTTLLLGETNPIFNIASVDIADAGSYSVVISNLCENVTSTTAVVTVNDLPTISNQPQGTTVCEGQPINLSVVATGAQLAYQWFKNGVAISGATASTFIIPNASILDAGDYTVNVNGLCGGTPVMSTIAQVVVNQIPTITQPSDVTVCSGQTVTLTIATSGGTNVTYQWFNGTVPIAGATSPTLTINNATVTDSGNYTCQVTSESCGTITSTVAVVIVNQAPAIVSQSGNQEICVGQALSLQVATTGTNLTYQWFKGTSPIAGANASTYNIPNAAQTDSGDYFVEISSASCPTFTGSVISVLVKQLPFATISAGPPSFICEGESTQVIFNGSADAIVTYTINGGSPQFITLVAGAATILATGALAETSVYELVSVTFAGANACSQALTGSATITVNPLPVVTLQDGKICVDPVTLATTRTFVLNTGLNEAEFTFEWFDVNGAILLATNSFYEVIVTGQYSVTITNIVTGCQASAFANVDQSAPPTDFTFTVDSFFADNPTVVITPTPAGQYEYQLDFGPFQDSNTFENISAGPHTLTVRDEEACGVLSKEILIVDYPRFFTPNGDGINDTWNITSIGNVSVSKIYIFDQFGKLIKEMTPSSLGWDGTYNGQVLPSNDYWFTINYQEAGLSKEFRSHFSLKR